MGSGKDGAEKFERIFEGRGWDFIELAVLICIVLPVNPTSNTVLKDSFATYSALPLSTLQTTKTTLRRSLQHLFINQ
jgi:hypothetical protein